MEVVEVVEAVVEAVVEVAAERGIEHVERIEHSRIRLGVWNFFLLLSD